MGMSLFGCVVKVVFTYTKNRLEVFGLPSANHMSKGMFQTKAVVTSHRPADRVTSTAANPGVSFDFYLQGLPGPPGPKVRHLFSFRESKVTNRAGCSCQGTVCTFQRVEERERGVTSNN